MKTTFIALTCILLLFSPFPHQARAIDTSDLPEASTSISGSLVVPPNTGIHILSHRGEWGAFFGSGGSGESFFLLAGELENTSGKPMAYVKFQFELLNEDGVVVVRDYGYNRKAEALREEDYETGKKTLAEMKIEQLAAGAREGFRFFFFRSDIPEFRTYRIRFLENH